MDKPRSNAALVANPLPWTIKHRPDGSLGIYDSDNNEIQTERTISSIIEFMRIVSPLYKIEGAKLDCPGCGEPLIASDGKWACDLNGNMFQHPFTCGCGRCEWTWINRTGVLCKCGTRVAITTSENGHVRVYEVT